jgi:hypothetical protein
MTTAKEHPIIFSGPMIRAILDGRKTMTRRAIKGVYQTDTPDLTGVDCIKDWDGGPSRLDWAPDNWEICPYGVVGDHLWCRESFLPCRGTGNNPAPIKEASYVCFRDGSQKFKNGHYYQDKPRTEYNWPSWAKWRSPILMPRWASRITLELTGVRVERLQAITEDDAIAEGFSSSAIRWWQGFKRHADGSRCMMEGGAPPDGPPPDWMESPELQTMTTTATEYFRAAWDALNGKRPGCAWADDPWVWVLSFERTGGGTE